MHSASVIAIVLLTELFLLALLARFCAWQARRRSVQALRAAFLQKPLAFSQEQAIVLEAQRLKEEIHQLHENLRQ